MKYAPSEVAASARPLMHILREMGIPSYVGGSLATTAYGAPRSTIDADIVADIRSEQVVGLLGRIEQDYFADAATINDAVQRRESFNVVHRKLLIKTDVFVLRHYRYERQVMDHIAHMPIDPANPDDLLPFCSVEDIILHKLMWYDQGGRTSERQWSDIQVVMKVQAQALDQPYLAKWADYLDVPSLLQEAIKQAGLDLK